MGLLSTIFDMLVSFADTGAKSVDRMSNSELEKKIQNSGKSVSEYRNFAAKTHELAERRKNNKESK